MKILTARQIREADSYTIENEPISSLDLMERAATACCEWIKENLSPENAKFHIFCGSGNNGGDGLVMARLLSMEGKKVFVYVLGGSKESKDFKTNLDKIDKRKVKLASYSDASFNIQYKEGDIIIDAIIGTGLNKPVSGWLREAIIKINSLPLMRISIDIPSGLFSEFNDNNDFNAVIKADFTLTFQLPKLAFMLSESGACCGDWYVIDIGLSMDFISRQNTSFNVISEGEIWLELKDREKFQHKGDFGHALIAAGSKGKMGAAVLASRACLRSGAGLVTALVPECGYDIIQTAVPEAMCITGYGDKELNGVPDLETYTVIGAGPGLGTSYSASAFLRELISCRRDALVLDADALNIIGGDRDLLEQLPEYSILTPHPGEFKRLAGNWTSDRDRLEKQVEFSKKNKVIVVLKGAHTSVSTPTGQLWFNPTGNPGMASAGSGDVLLGMITGLLARGYEPAMAACMGVYLHGLAGDHAALKFGQESMTAVDIAGEIHTALLSMYRS